jgi:hypothetical protein
VKTDATVVADLLVMMKQTVRSYPASMIEVDGGIAGTCFFPGGRGLFQNADSTWPVPPRGKIMVVGNDWGTKTEYDDFVRQPSKEMKSSTWRGLLGVLAAALGERNLTLGHCFFTNAYMGVRKSGSSMGECPGRSDAVFRRECSDFLGRQIAHQEPALIFTIGKWAPEVMASLAPPLAPWAEAGRKPEWKHVDQCGPLHTNVVFDVLPSRMVTVAALTHPALAGSNYRHRKYSELEDERGLILAAVDAAFPR